MKIVQNYIIVFTVFFTSLIVYYKPNLFVIYSLIFISGILLVKNNLYEIRKNKNRIVFLLLFLIYFWIPKDDFFHQISLGLFLNLILAVLIVNLSRETQAQVYKGIVRVLSYVILPGLILFILSNYLNVMSVNPFVSNFKPGESSSRIYSIFPFFVSEITNGFRSIRFASIFDEPGYLGTILFFILLIDDFNFKRKSNLVFLIAGLLSFSLAFYSLIFVYYSYTLFIKRKYLVFVLSLIILSSFYFFFYANIDELILQRMIYNTNSSTIIGDNRGGLILQLEALRYLFDNDLMIFFFGNGINVNTYHFDFYGQFADSVWIRLVYQLGLIPLISFIFYLSFIARKYSGGIVFLGFFIISLYQRPQIFNILFLFLLFYGIRGHKTQTG